MRLSEIAPMVRKGIAVLLIFIFFYVMFNSVALPILSSVFTALFPGKDAPTVAFGQLEPLQFIEKSIVGEKPEIILNTKTGRLPSLPGKLPVYKLKPYKFSYSNGKEAQNQAVILGFTEADLITDLKGNAYRWRSTESEGVLDISIHSKELLLNTPLEGKSSYFNAVNWSEQLATQAAVNLFGSLNRFNDSAYKDGPKKVAFGRFAGPAIVEAETISSAQIARVDLFRKIGDYVVYGPDPQKGLLHAFLRAPGNRENPSFNYPKVEAYYHEYESILDATYPLISVSQAWNAVKKGDGVIASVVPSGLSPFAEYQPVEVRRAYINNIYLAYYEAQKGANYVQPIFVFEGNYATDGGTKGTISIYYPAVSGKWVKPASE